MKKFSLTGMILACIAVAAALWLGIMPGRQPQWPYFPPSDAAAPQYEVEQERDFGYRTGNHVPVTVYFRVPSGTEIDTQSLSVEGDLGLVERRFFRQKVEGGIEFVRADLVLQGFVYKPRWEVRIAVEYCTAGDGERHTLKLAPVHVSTSRTFDDRNDKHPLDPELARLDGTHLVWTVALIVGGAAGLIGSTTMYLVRRRRRRRVSFRPDKASQSAGAVPSAGVGDIWRAIVNGDRSKQRYTALLVALRARADAAALQVDGSADEVREQNKLALEKALVVLEDAVWGDNLPGDAQLDALGQAMAVLCKTKTESPGK